MGSLIYLVRPTVSNDVTEIFSKNYSRTPGSRQPSPTDEELNKSTAVQNNSVGNSHHHHLVGVSGGQNNVVVVDNNIHAAPVATHSGAPHNNGHYLHQQQLHHPTPRHHHHPVHHHHHPAGGHPPHSILNHHGIPLTTLHPPPHMTQMDSLAQPFDQIMNMDPSAYDPQQHPPTGHPQLNHIQAGIDAAGTMQNSYEIQQVSRFYLFVNRVISDISVEKITLIKPMKYYIIIFLFLHMNDRYSYQTP